MIGCLRTHVRKQPIIAIYFEFENELKFYNLMAELSSKKPLSSIRYKVACRYSKDSNQLAHLHHLISVLVLQLKNVGHLAFDRTPIKDSDQTAQMCRMVRVYDVCTCKLYLFFW